MRGFSGGDVTTGRTLTLPSPLQRERQATRKTDVFRVQRESTNSKATVLIGRVSNGHRDGSDHDLMGYIVFTYTFHVWGAKRDVAPVATHGSGVK